VGIQANSGAMLQAWQTSPQAAWRWRFRKSSRGLKAHSALKAHTFPRAASSGLRIIAIKS
jgi:hypothetical protein